MLAPLPPLGPELAFALLAVAILGLLLEAATPGVGLGALLGLALGAVAMLTLVALDVQPLGVAAAVLAALLLTAGLFVRPLLLQPLGVVAFAVAGLTLFRDPDAVGPLALLGVTAALALASVVLARLVRRTRQAPVFRGQAGTLVGERGEVRQGAAAGEPVRVLVAGALWRARADVPLTRGDRIVVTGREDLELRVAPAELPDRQREGSHGQA